MPKQYDEGRGVRSLVVLTFLGGLVLPVGCGGGGESKPGNHGVTPSRENVLPITVDSGPTNGYVNGVFAGVTVCVPGDDSDCETIGDLLVDTGSVGLRILSSALSVSLPQQTGAAGKPVAECLPFLDGYTWGPVQLADVKMAGEQANSVPIQVIGDPDFSAVPSPCTNYGLPSMDTLQTLSANGILGVGLFRQDCGSACAVNGPSNPGLYYECSSSGCQQAVETLTQQVQNPVWLFAEDNNGVIIKLPSIPTTGKASVNGSLIFGIGTQANNGLGTATILATDADGTFTTLYRGRSYGSSFIDSGSNGIFFLESVTTGIRVCNDAQDWYCPSSTQSVSATNRGADRAATDDVTFAVANADSLLANPAHSAFSNLAGPNPGSFDWGLPFFFGRAVFTAIEGQDTPAGYGPYLAY
jgi:hypothetical protein